MTVFYKYNYPRGELAGTSLPHLPAGRLGIDCDDLVCRTTAELPLGSFRDVVVEAVLFYCYCYTWPLAPDLLCTFYQSESPYQCREPA